MADAVAKLTIMNGLMAKMCNIEIYQSELLLQTSTDSPEPILGISISLVPFTFRGDEGKELTIES